MQHTECWLLYYKYSKINARALVIQVEFYTANIQESGIYWLFFLGIL